MKLVLRVAVLVGVLLAASVVRVDGDERPQGGKSPDKKSRLDPKREEAERRELVRLDLLDAYRTQRRVAAGYIVGDNEVQAETDTRKLSTVILYVEDGGTLMFWGQEVEPGTRSGMFWALTSDRFVICAVGKGQVRVVGRGQGCAQARVIRINRVIEQLNLEREAGVQPLDSWQREIQISLVRGTDGRPVSRAGIAVTRAAAETPSWLTPARWEQLSLHQTGPDHVELRSEGVRRRIDTHTGLLVGHRVAGKDGKTVAGVKRAPMEGVEVLGRKYLSSLRAMPLNEDGRRIDLQLRQLDCRDLLSHLARRTGETEKLPAWIVAAAPDLARAVFDDALGEEDVHHVVAWGRSILETLSEGLPKDDGSKLRADVMAEMQESLHERWWKPVEQTLTPGTRSELTAALPPLKPSPAVSLAILLRGAIRNHVKQRVAAAWTE